MLTRLIHKNGKVGDKVGSPCYGIYNGCGGNTYFGGVKLKNSKQFVYCTELSESSFKELGVDKLIDTCSFYADLTWSVVDGVVEVFIDSSLPADAVMCRMFSIRNICQYRPQIFRMLQRMGLSLMESAIFAELIIPEYWGSIDSPHNCFNIRNDGNCSSDWFPPLSVSKLRELITRDFVKEPYQWIQGPFNQYGYSVEIKSSSNKLSPHMNNVFEDPQLGSLSSGTMYGMLSKGEKRIDIRNQELKDIVFLLLEECKKDNASNRHTLAVSLGRKVYAA